MSGANLIQYLANILLVGSADDKVVPAEGEATELIMNEIGATLDDLEKAAKFINDGSKRITPTGRLSDRVRNLEDMVLVAVADGELPEKEKRALLAFAKEIGLDREQVYLIVAEAKRRLR